MIDCRIDGDLAIVSLNRPDKANALTEIMLRDLIDAVKTTEHAHALILTGTGRVFSAGADLEQVATLATSPLWESVSSAIANHPGLTIAALNGTVAGGSMGMALACDLRIAHPAARFFYPVLKMGVRPQPSDPGRLIALCGPARARHLLLAGQKWTADQALAFGLVEELTDDPVGRARMLCDAALKATRDHVTALKCMT